MNSVEMCCEKEIQCICVARRKYSAYLVARRKYSAYLVARRKAARNVESCAQNLRYNSMQKSTAERSTAETGPASKKSSTSDRS
jgi:hypothetical protein